MYANSIHYGVVNVLPEYLSVSKVYPATCVLVLQKIPFGNKIPSSGKLKLTTSPVGTSAKNKVSPVFEVVVSSKTPAPPPLEAIMIPLNLTGVAIIASVPAAAVDQVACISHLAAMFYS